MRRVHSRTDKTQGYGTEKTGLDLTREMKDLEHSLDQKMKDLEHGLSRKLASAKSSFESHKYVTKTLCTELDIELMRYTLGAAFVVTAVFAWPFPFEKTKKGMDGEKGNSDISCS
ncbi:unnamed protein product [Urochloa humidicola]